MSYHAALIVIAVMCVTCQGTIADASMKNDIVTDNGSYCIIEDHSDAQNGVTSKSIEDTDNIADDDTQNGVIGKFIEDTNINKGVTEDEWIGSASARSCSSGSSSRWACKNVGAGCKFAPGHLNRRPTRSSPNGETCNKHWCHSICFGPTSPRPPPTSPPTPSVLPCSSGSSSRWACNHLNNGCTFAKSHSNRPRKWRNSPNKGSLNGESCTKWWCQSICFSTTDQPTAQPTAEPSKPLPSAEPTPGPSTEPTSQPSAIPSSGPSTKPTSQPSAVPSSGPSGQPTLGEPPATTGKVWGYSRDMQWRDASSVDLTNLVDTSCGGFACVARKLDGTGLAWGPSTRGGGASSVDLTDLVDISCGWKVCVARKLDGTGLAWGDTHGGDASPVNLTDLVDISCGGYACVARKSDGTGLAWGHPHLGGDASSVDLTDLVDISAVVVMPVLLGSQMGRGSHVEALHRAGTGGGRKFRRPH